MSQYCKHCYVSGRVQGVFYRASTLQQARVLGVNGYAKNLADGRVEVLACGKQQQVEALCDWLWQGPEYASVSDVECEIVEAVEMNGFTTG